MKKIISISLCMMVLFGSSFIGASPDPLPAPAPNYTMIDIPDPPSCYALEVELVGGSSDICYDPNYSSIWNMDDFYFTNFKVVVSVKWSQYGGWYEIGEIWTNDSNVTLTYVPGGAVGKMEFSYYDLVTP
ncbi:MAG: hypothetical protein U9N86_02970 [Bacteroidota bacterium]|nr:hypothetical protein [Bacteroidota bacterium]